MSKKNDPEIPETLESINDTEIHDLQEYVQDYTRDIKYSELSRRDIRSLIFHILYAYDAFDYSCSLESIVDNLNRGFELDIPLNSEVVVIVQKVADLRDDLDKTIIGFLANWRLERLGVSTKLILRLSFWEFLNSDTPPTVIINEAVELAKCFSEVDAYKFINGVLDEYAKSLVPVEK